MQSWLEKWSEWEIQAVVAVSFSLQVILFFLAGIRRYSIWSVLKVLLWLVYLLADSAAIYALGHMSMSLSKTSSDKNQLVAFWAPFLLLHLGGQDTITAYALEDNKLWLRHLLNMFVQVVGTGYVLYKHIIADKATILSAAVLVSLSGFVKYSERIWALRCASKGYSGMPYRTGAKPAENCFTRNERFRTYATSVLSSHICQYHYVKPVIIDRTGPSIFASTIVPQLEIKYTEVYRGIGMQLALTYDMLYTKAVVIHTWYGHIIRAISFLSCFGALVAFIRSKRDRYSTPDTVFTFVLLGGACALEVTSAFKVIGSTWTYAILRYYGWSWLASAILFARYHLIVVNDGRWSNSVGQFDFISFCVSDKIKLKERIVRCFGFKDWSNKAHYIKHAKLSPALKEFVCSSVRGEKSHMVQIEDVTIVRGYWARKLMGFNQSEKLDWSLRLQFHNCVLIWHIATYTFLSNPDVKSMLVDKGMAEAVNTLSDYMMYLLIQHPNILPINVADLSLFEETYATFVNHWNPYFEKHTEKGTLVLPHQIILDYMDEKSPYPDITWNKDLYQDLTSSLWDAYAGEAVLVKANILVRTILDMELELTHKLVIIGTVWKEMLCYTATNASGDFHARQLSNGGEFLTHMLLLTIFCSVISPEVETRDTESMFKTLDYTLDFTANVKPRVDVADHIELNVYNDRQEEITECR
jgi:hypothetical protein